MYNIDTNFVHVCFTGDLYEMLIENKFSVHSLALKFNLWHFYARINILFERITVHDFAHHGHTKFTQIQQFCFSG